MSSTTGLRPELGRSSGAVAAQATAAGGSLVIQIIAARVLGASTYGRFTILFAGLVLLAALHGGFVGDARTVLDRTDPDIRGALFACQSALTGLAAVTAAGVAWATGFMNGSGFLLVGALTALWLSEDAGRRLFMTRLEFWRLVVNDLVYLAGALAGLTLVWLSNGKLDLVGLVIAMAVGAGTAVGHAAWVLPKAELRRGPVSSAGVRAVADFGLWRSAHAGVRPLATLVLRTAVSAIVSASALGRLEAARLTVAPMLMVTNGVGSYLLPRSALNQKESPGSRQRLLPVALVLVGVGLVYGVIAVAGAGVLVPLMAGKSGAVDRWAVAGWALFMVAFAAGIPAGTTLLAQRRSSLVFGIRAMDSALGLALALVLVVLLGASAAPFGLAVGAALGALLLWPYALGTLPGPAPQTSGGTT